MAMRKPCWTLGNRHSQLLNTEYQIEALSCLLAFLNTHIRGGSSFVVL